MYKLILLFIVCPIVIAINIYVIMRTYKNRNIVKSQKDLIVENLQHFILLVISIILARLLLIELLKF